MKRQLIAELWNSYSREVLPGDAPQIQRQECRRAFYSGAKALLFALEQILSPGPDETEGDLKMMEEVSKELSEFVEAVKGGRG